jgi:predicted phosphodiesterase
MRLGLLADVHEAIPQLCEALGRFRPLAVDEVVVLGDICGMHQHLAETLTLLRDARAVGVWGNHDFGLCRPIEGSILAARYSSELLAYARTYQPRLVRADCHFSHVEAWLNPESLEDLWFFDGMPTTPERLARSFDAVPQRVLFSGHVHRWFVATPEGPLAWDTAGPLMLRRERRWYVTVHAVCLGFAAVYDTDTCELLPLVLTPPRTGAA